MPDEYKYIAYSGICNINKLYDKQNDLYEVKNLIRNKEMGKIGLKLRNKLFV